MSGILGPEKCGRIEYDDFGTDLKYGLSSSAELLRSKTVPLHTAGWPVYGRVGRTGDWIEETERKERRKRVKKYKPYSHQILKSNVLPGSLKKVSIWRLFLS